MSLASQEQQDLRTIVPQHERLLWADLIRSVAIGAVIMLHAASVPVIRLSQENPDAWIWALTYRSIASACIPLFIMLSGALLLCAPTWNPQQFFKKRATKILIPLVGWSIIYGLWGKYFHDQPLTISQFLLQLIGGIAHNAYIHLWFLYLILSLYLLVPIFIIYVRYASFSNQLYCAGLWLTATAILPLLNKWLGISIDLYLQPLVGLVGYFVLGATFMKFIPLILPPRWLIGSIAGFFLAFLATFWGTYQFTIENNGTLYEELFSYSSLNVMIMSITAFALLRHLGALIAACRLMHLHNFLRVTSALSFGIYLSHVLIMELLESGRLGIIFTRMQYPPSYGVPLMTITLFILSFGLVWFLRQIKIMRWLLP